MFFDSEKERLTTDAVDTWVPDVLQEKCWSMVDEMAEKGQYKLNRFQLFEFRFEKKAENNLLIITHSQAENDFKYETSMIVPEKMSLANFPVLGLIISEDGPYQLMSGSDNDYKEYTGVHSPFKYYYFSKKERRILTNDMPVELQEICWGLIDKKIEEKKYDITEMQCFEIKKDYQNNKLIIRHYQPYPLDEKTTFDYIYETELTKEMQTFDALTVYAVDLIEHQGFMIDTDGEYKKIVTGKKGAENNG